jgi:putative peptidoglycan lipid II flippase
MSESRTVTRRAGIVAAATLASRVLGMVRDMVVAGIFPPVVTDLFYTAFTIPNALRRLAGEGSLTVAFIPVMTETMETEGRDASRRLVAAMSGVSLVFLTLLSVAGVLAAPWIVWGYGSGFSRFPGRIELAGDLTRILFPYILVAGLVALTMGVLNTVGRFFAPAFSPVLLNLGIIGGGLLLAGPLGRAGYDPVIGLALGVMIGGLAQVALQVPYLRVEGMLPWPRFDLRHPGVRTVLRLMGPSVFGVAVYQVNIILSRTFASFCPEGSVTYLYYAFRMVELPQGLFVYALASAMLPSLSVFAARKDFAGMNDGFLFALRQTLFVALPASVGLGVLALPIVSVLFQRGAFDAECAVQTAWALLYQAPGIVLVAGVRQTVPMFFALKDTRTPVWASIVNLVSYVALCLVLMGPMLHAGISLAVSLAAGLQLVVLLAVLRTRTRALGLSSLGLACLVPCLVRCSVASCACGAAAWATARLGRWELGGNDARNIGVLALALCAGAAAYAVVSFLLRSDEARELLDALRRRRSGRRT